MIEERPSERRRPDLGAVLAALSVGGLVVLAAVMGRHLWFFSDDWNILTRYHDGNLLEPFNGHLSALPAGIYTALFHTVGLGSYWPYRLVGLAGMALLGVLSYCYARTRVGSLAGALAATAIVWGSGGVTNVMFPFLVNFSLPIALLIAVWMLLDREADGADVAASLCLAAALATSGLGVLAMGSVGVELALSRAKLRRWITFAPPVVLWLAWYVTHQIDSPGSHGVRSVASYAARMFWGGCTALAANWKPGGVLVALAFAGVIVVAALRWRSLDARSVGALVSPLLFCGLTAFTRLHVVPAIAPDEYRYRWTVAAGLVLATVCMWRRSPTIEGSVPRDVSPVTRFGGQNPGVGAGWVVRVVGIAAVVVVGIGAGELVRDIRTWDRTVVTAAPGLRADLFAAEAVGHRVPAGTVLPLSYVPVTVGEYQRAVADVGSPLAGLDPATFGGTEDHRISADTLLVHGFSPSSVANLIGCTAIRSGAAIRPGSTVQVFPSTASIRIARFSTDGVALGGFVRDGLFPEVFLIPKDAPGAPRGAPGYRVLAPDATSISACP